jgi:hypothetical protein
MKTFESWFRNQIENCKSTSGHWDLNFPTESMLKELRNQKQGARVRRRIRRYRKAGGMRIKLKVRLSRLIRAQYDVKSEHTRDEDG